MILSDCIQARSMLSLAPLLTFWETELLPRCPYMADLFAGIMEHLPLSLKGDIQDISALEEYPDIVHTLMTAVVSPASYDRELTAAFAPCSFEGFYATPRFQHLFLDRGHALKPTLKEKFDSDMDRRFLSVYYLVLERIYGFSGPLLSNLQTRVLTDEKTGLDRYYEEVPDYRFVDLTPVGVPRPLSEADHEWILDHLTDQVQLARLIDLSQFEFRGFVIIRVQDVTEKAILMGQVTPLFAVALKRGQDELTKQVQTVIKAQCTAVHPSVEWRFEKAGPGPSGSVAPGKAFSENGGYCFQGCGAVLRAV